MTLGITLRSAVAWKSIAKLRGQYQPFDNRTPIYCRNQIDFPGSGKCLWRRKTAATQHKVRYSCAD